MPQVFPVVSPSSISDIVQQLANGSTTGVIVNPALDSSGNPAQLGFFGVGPVTQPTGGEQTSPRGIAGGALATFATTATPAAVVTLTTAEITMTPVIGTGGVFTVTTTDILVVNKPAAQAGIGIGNARYASATTIGVTFSNITAGTLTPTAAQIYGVTALRNVGGLTATLTPASVATKTTAEQLFTVAGLSVGQLVVVNKPTSQAGLDIVGVRIAAANTLGITFANFTAGTLTPTAGEVYSIAPLDPLDAVSNQMVAQIPIVGTQPVATVTSAEITLTSGDIGTQDVISGVSKPTLQAGLMAGSARVASSTTIAMTFMNTTAGTLTPTAGEVQTITIFRQNPVAPLVLYSQTLTPAGVATLTTAEQTFTVTGLVAGSPAWVNKPSAQAGIGIVGVRVSAANTLAINYLNTTTATLTPASETYIIGNFQIPIDTTTGNSWIQSISDADANNETLVDNLRAALVSLGLISGAA